MKNDEFIAKVEAKIAKLKSEGWIKQDFANALRGLFFGRRARFPDEKCPRCEDPGCGMILDVEKQEWICSRCKEE